MKNFSAEFIAKKSMNYYESLSKDVIREVQAEINGLRNGDYELEFGNGKESS